MKTAVRSFHLLALCGLAAPVLAEPTFSPAGLLAAASRPAAVATLDLDHDGDLDLAVTVDTPDRVLTFLNTGGVYTPGQAVLLGAGVGADGLVAADFDGDGWTDLAVSQHNTDSLRIIGNIAGILIPGAAVATGVDPRSLFTGDFNADGRTDLVSVNRDGGDVTVALNTAAGWSASNVAVGEDPRNAAFLDADGDGDADMIVTNHRDRNASLLRNTGGAFAAWSVIPTGGGLRPDGVDAGDLNGDGRPDFAVGQDNNGVGFVSVFLNQGGGVFIGPAHFAAGGANTGAVLLRDFDHDGDVDAAAANQDSASVTLLNNPGSGALALFATLSAGAGPERMLAADLDGDGSLDLAVNNRGGDTVSLFQNLAVIVPCPADFNGDGFTDFFDYTDFAAAFETGAPGADFNGDGFADFFDYADFVAAFELGC